MGNKFPTTLEPLITNRRAVALCSVEHDKYRLREKEKSVSRYFKIFQDIHLLEKEREREREKERKREREKERKRERERERERKRCRYENEIRIQKANWDG